MFVCNCSSIMFSHFICCNYKIINYVPKCSSLCTLHTVILYLRCVVVGCVFMSLFMKQVSGKCPKYKDTLTSCVAKELQM